ncbi:MAG TPA: pyrroloquinoline quinone-dependent dehydrogenase, partial [Segetibacter sp.]
MIRKYLSVALSFAIFAVTCYIAACNNKESSNFTGWEMAHGNSFGNKYSSLIQIDTSNVQQLQVAWEYHTGDADTAANSQIQCNPIIINGIMYG